MSCPGDAVKHHSQHLLGVHGHDMCIHLSLTLQLRLSTTEPILWFN